MMEEYVETVCNYTAGLGALSVLIFALMASPMLLGVRMVHGWGRDPAITMPGYLARAMPVILFLGWLFLGQVLPALGGFAQDADQGPESPFARPICAGSIIWVNRAFPLVIIAVFVWLLYVFLVGVLKKRAAA